MKAGMYYNNNDVRVEELPIPEIGDHDILLKVMACGICGSDIMEWYRVKRAPLVLGHELSGEVVKVGKDVKKFKIGDRVFSTHHVPCGSCRYCVTGHETVCSEFHTKNNFQPGGFSEYLKIFGRSVDTGTFILPDNITYEQGTFIEPLGTAIRGLRTADLKSHDTLLVLGSGTAGILIIKLACALEVPTIIATDINDFRLELARRFGADHVIKANADLAGFVREVNGGRLADKVIICNSSLASSQQAFQCVDKGGTIVFFAVPKPGETLAVDFNSYWRDDISIKTSYGAAPADNIKAMGMIKDKDIRVDDMITHRFSLTEIGKGFQTASGGSDSLKVIIEPPLNNF